MLMDSGTNPCGFKGLKMLFFVDLESNSLCRQGLWIQVIVFHCYCANTTSNGDGVKEGKKHDG